MANPMRYNLGVRINDRKIMDAMKETGPGIVLDVGCGLGYTTNRVASGKDVVGMDIDKKSLKFAKHDGSAMFVVGDALRLPFKDSSISTIVASEIIEHMPDDRAFVGELGRVAKPGASLMITTPSTEGVLRVTSECHESGPERHYRPGYTRSELAELLARDFKIGCAKYSMTFFTRLIMELTKRAYSRKYKRFSHQMDVLRATDSKSFKAYKFLFPIFMLFVYIDDALSKILKGSNIMVMARRHDRS